jgi:hypothetical protein
VPAVPVGEHPDQEGEARMSGQKETSQVDPVLKKALKTALEVIRDGQMPKHYHRTKAEVMDEIGTALKQVETQS